MTTSHRGYVTASALVFTVVALAQAWRAVVSAPVEIGGQAIPVAFSWIAFVVAGSLAAWGWRTR